MWLVHLFIIFFQIFPVRFIFYVAPYTAFVAPDAELPLSAETNFCCTYFILCPVTLQLKNCMHGGFGFVTKLGRDHQTRRTTRRHVMEIQPRRLPQDTYSTGHKALPHHKKRVPPARFSLPVPKHQCYFSSLT